MRPTNNQPRSVDAVTRRKRDDPRPVAAQAPANPGGPSRDDAATVGCPVCERLFVAGGRGRYCSDGCRKTAWRRRHQTPAAVIVVPDRRPRRPITVYECASCGERSLGEQRCNSCGTFAARVGLGGLCPHCDLPVAVDDLVDPSMIPAADRTGRR